MDEKVSISPAAVKVITDKAAAEIEMFKTLLANMCEELSHTALFKEEAPLILDSLTRNIEAKMKLLDPQCDVNTLTDEGRFRRKELYLKIIDKYNIEKGVNKSS